MVIYLILTVLLSPTVNAEGWSLLTPKMIIRTEVAPSEITTLTKQIGIKNNNVSAQVSLDLMGDLVNIVKLEEESFVLQPNEEKWVNFTVELTKPGDYYGDIVVVFSPETEEKPAAGLAAEVIILAKEAQRDEIISDKDSIGRVNLTLISVTITVILFIGILTLFIIHKKRMLRK